MLQSFVDVSQHVRYGTTPIDNNHGYLGLFGSGLSQFLQRELVSTHYEDDQWCHHICNHGNDNMC